MVDGVLQVQDAVLERVADVVLGVAGGGHLLIEGALHQLLVLQHNRQVTVTWSELSRHNWPKLIDSGSENMTKGLVVPQKN